MMLRNGGSFTIDGGKPAPGLIETTARNLKEVSPTLYFNVPRGFDLLLPFLERDAALRRSFFRDLDMLFYAAAALPQNLWQRLEAMAMAEKNGELAMISSWGSTETAPSAAAVHYHIERAGVIGLPNPGCELKLVPAAGKLEVRVRGPHVTPGYFRRDDLTRAAFDEEGFYRIGDAGKFADPEEPAKGLVFDGRVSEDFKLTTGTWVHVGGLRLSALEAAAPLLQDAVVTGHDRDYVGLLAWPEPGACRRLINAETADMATLAAAPAVVEQVRRCLQERNAGQKGSSTRIERVLLLTDPPDLDAGEITDKGYVNQRATLNRRAALVEHLYTEPPPADVIVL
jgi:feruloyl-CoA synthase